MSMIDRFSFQAQTSLPGVPFETLRAAFRARAAEHDLPMLRDEASDLQIETAYGTYSLRLVDAAPCLGVQSWRLDWLYVLKESLSEALTALSPDLGAAIRWSDAAESAGCLPPNFQFLTIETVERLPGGFLRVTAQAEDLSPFTPEAIHFRLALPAPGLATPVWPHLSESGLTIWPKGAAALHRPVYTVRDIDRARGLLVFDVFVHQGGRASQWAQTVAPGARVGLTGPGGGGIPEAGAALAVFADETGFPAVARILAALPAEATGTICLESTVPGSQAYPMPEHPGFRIHRDATAGGRDLADLAIRALADHPAHRIWFAAEKRQAQKLRAHLKTHGLSAKAHDIAGYWSRSAAGGEA